MRSIGRGSKSIKSRLLNFPKGVCLSANGEWLFVADCTSCRVRVFRARNGKHVHTIGCKGGGEGQFYGLRSVCVSPNGEFLFVTDSVTYYLNNRVQAFSLS